MDFAEYAGRDALGLARLVADREVSPAELLDLARSRADAVEPQLNAICLRLDEFAEQRLDRELAGPFAGVPFLLKDLGQDLEGVPTSEGCRALVDRPAAATSTVVTRWLDAGLVPFGKTSTPEFGAQGVTEPELFGPTRNPWDTEHTPGGSSGGSAAAVAAGVVPVAGASDGGGSIRIPAACTGLFGLKPGRGLVPAGPHASEPALGIAVSGVVSRSVRDSAAMLDVLAGADAVSAYAPAMPERPFLDEVGADPGVLRIGYTTSSAIRSSPHPEAVAAVEATARLLEDLGHEVEEVPPPHDDAQLSRDFLTIWFVRAATEVERVSRLTGAGDRDFERDTRVMASLGRLVSGTELLEAEGRRHDHIAALSRLHATHDLLLTPSLGEPPLRIGELDLPLPFDLASEALLTTRTTRLLKATGLLDRFANSRLAWVPYTQLANLTGRPAMSVPLHQTEAGLPLGVQFVAPLRGEATLLRLAASLEQAAPWDGRLQERALALAAS